MPSDIPRAVSAVWRAFLLAGVALFVAGATQAQAATVTNKAPDEYAAFGRAFANLAPRGWSSVDETFDLDALVNRVCFKSNADEEARADIRAYLRKTFETVLSTAGGADMRFLRVREQNGERHVIVRVVNKDSALAYWVLACEMRSMKTVKAVDFYSMSTGEWMSESTRRLVVGRKPDRNLFGRLIGGPSPDEKREKATGEFLGAFHAGQYAAMLKKFDELPPELQREKTYLSLRTQAAEKVGTAEYAAAIRCWRVNCPKDPAVDLNSLDCYLLQGKYDLGLEAIDRVDAAVGGDPHLDSFRAVMYEKLGSNDLAAAARKRYVAGEKALVEATTFRAVRASERFELDYQPPALIPASVRMAARSNAAAQAKAAVPVPSANPTVAAKPGTLRLQGVFMHADHPSALIGGQSVSEGDTIEGNKVVKIEATRLTLQNPQGELIRVTFQ